jgi:hypothetical protein
LLLCAGVGGAPVWCGSILVLRIAIVTRVRVCATSGISRGRGARVVAWATLIGVVGRGVWGSLVIALTISDESGRRIAVVRAIWISVRRTINRRRHL